MDKKHSSECQFKKRTLSNGLHDSSTSDECDYDACADDEREHPNEDQGVHRMDHDETRGAIKDDQPDKRKDGQLEIVNRDELLPPSISEEDTSFDEPRSIELEDELPGSKPSEDLQKSDFVLDPDGDGSYYWMGVVTLAVIYNYWVVILRIAFSEMRDEVGHTAIFMYMDILCDTIYISDIIVQVRTAYLEHGIFVTDPLKLSTNYRNKPEFRRDVLSILPLGSVIQIIASIINSDVLEAYVGDDKLPIHASRLPRLLKLHTMSKFFQNTDSRTNNPNAVRAFKLSLYLGVVIHWIGCFYYIASEYEGFGSNDWVYPADKGHQNFLSKYIRSFYWSLVTLTTIGGSANPVTNLEYIFTGITFLIGVFVFAAVVGNVGDVISNMNAARAEFQSRMDAIKFYMNHRKVPEYLQKRVKKWSDYSWHRTQMIDESSLLEMLPERLRAEIAIHVHLETLKKVNIFEGCEQGLLCELVLKLKSQIYSPGDYICKTGEIGREMYIINHGKVEVVITEESTGSRMVIATMSEGNYFGEISLLKLDAGCNKRTADVRSVGYSELLVLSRKDLMGALVEYPDAKKVLEAQGRSTMKRISQLGEKVEYLKFQLQQRDVELRKALLRVIQLEHILEAPVTIQRTTACKEQSATDGFSQAFSATDARRHVTANGVKQHSDIEIPDNMFLDAGRRESRSKRRNIIEDDVLVRVPGICVNGPAPEQSVTGVMAENACLSDSSRPSTPETPTSPGLGSSFVYMDGPILTNHETILPIRKKNRNQSESTNYTSDLTNSEFDDSDFDFR
ncbi:cyclic nucleotide-gated channel rod photoreceptor subunit alpha-like [Saccoglossus kowalevskii]